MSFISCKLCQDEYVLLKNHCDTCEKIKRIINVYGKEKVLDILDKVCLRKSEKLQEYKIKNIKNEIEKPKIVTFEETKPNGDSTYIQPNNTLNKDYMDELKKKLSQ